MSTSPPFDLVAAHRWFSADCFNRVWGFLDKQDRSPEDDERMVSLCHASLAHWRERPDCLPQNLSVGYWQLSRVLAVIGHAATASHYGRLSLEAAAAAPPFFLGYAHEALARAAAAAGDQASARFHLEEAGRHAARIQETDDREALEADLATIQPMLK